MARQKGIVQKRDESKYLLPLGVSLVCNQQQNYNKETKLLFLDSIYGEFESTFKAIQNANASTHPKAVSARRAETNLKVHGATNPSQSISIQNKRKQTMMTRFNGPSPFSSIDVRKKAQETNIQNLGVSSPFASDKIRQKSKQTVQTKYNVSNVMHVPAFKQKGIATSLKNHGVPNGGGSIVAKNKILQSLQNSGNLRSEGELEIESWISSLGLNCGPSFIGGSNPKQLDIKIPSLNIAIEYNGCYWHSEIIKGMHKNYHLQKTNLAKDVGLSLIHIWDYEWENRKEQVKSFLLSKFGKNKNKVYARNCKLQEIDNTIANDFYEKYHILGKSRSIKSYGLYYNEELIQCISIGRHHRNNTEYILNRFCGKTDWTVTGGLSKLTKTAIKDFGAISTWVDLRFSDGEGWVTAGWTKEKTLRPDYFYYNKNKAKIVSKQSRQKKMVNTPKNMTEHEHALQEGLYRVYDCGKIKLKIS